MTAPEGNEAPSPSAPPPSPTATPPTPADLAWTAAITALKGTVIALAVDAFLNSNSPRYHGKGMRLRAIGYAGGLLIAPVAWRIRGRKEPYPRALDLAITIPLLVDAGGNATGMYRRAHMDDLIHFLDGAIVSSVVGALATPRVRTSWEAAGVGCPGRWRAGGHLGDRRVDRAQGRGEGHGPVVRRHDDRPRGDDVRGAARGRRHAPAAPAPAAPGAGSVRAIRSSSRRTTRRDGGRTRASHSGTLATPRCLSSSMAFGS